MSEHAYLSLRTASDLIRSKRLSARELTSETLKRIDKLDQRLNAFITITGEHALEMAARAERDILQGEWRGPLHGIPIALKDLIDTRFAPTTAGMPVFRNRVPSQNATIVKRLEAAGAIIVGKLAMTEGAYSSHHAAMPTPCNPWSKAHWTGVSSSGSGVATAAGLCFGALASDTGGSIRLPSTACGVTGMKPTWGRVSRHGVLPFAETLDHVGPMARSVEDVAIILHTIAGYDANDPTSLTDAVPDYLSLLNRGVDKIRFGIDESALTQDISPEISASISAAVQTIRQLGGKLIDVSVPPVAGVLHAFSTLCAAEAFIAHRPIFSKHADAYGAGLSALMATGMATDEASIAHANIERRRWKEALAALFADVDMLVLPAIPMPVPEIAQLSELAADPSMALARFTIPFNMSGSPTLTLPSGVDANGLPIGMQLVGRHLSEDLLLRAGHSFQQATNWHTRRPVL